MTPRIALVTGGARRIGASICRRLAAAGMKVVIHCHRSKTEADALAREIGEAAVISGDLADLGQLERLYDEAARPFGPPDILVNNASVFLDDHAGSLVPEQIETQFAINLHAPLLLAQAFARTLPADRAGAIVNIIDQRVLRPNPQYFSYSLTKAALFTATKTLAQAYAPRIRVNGVGPGPVLPNARDGIEGLQAEAGATLLGLIIAPEEIAEAVLFLVKASGVTGQMIAVDGGQHLGWRTPDILG